MENFYNLFQVNINASISLQNEIKFNLPKLGFIQEIEKIIVYNLLGQMVKNSTGNHKKLDMSDLNAGTYLVKIYTEFGVTDKKILKK